MAIHWYIGGPTFGGTPEQVEEQCLQFEMGLARTGDRHYLLKHGAALRSEFAENAIRSASEGVALKSRLDDLGVRIAAAQAKHGSVRVAHPV